MQKTLSFNEKKNLVDSRLRFNFNVEEENELLAEAAYGLYRSISQIKRNISGFIVFSKKGSLVRALAKYRPLSPIFAFAPNAQVADRLLVSFGVVPFVQGEQNLEEAFASLKKSRYAKKDDIFVILYPASNRGARLLGISNVV